MTPKDPLSELQDVIDDVIKQHLPATVDRPELVARMLLVAISDAMSMAEGVGLREERRAAILHVIDKLKAFTQGWPNVIDGLKAFTQDEWPREWSKWNVKH